jgi:hypothetical protein
MDAAEFVGLDSPTGVTATMDVDAALAACDAVAYMASGDIGPRRPSTTSSAACGRASTSSRRRCTRSTTPAQHRRNGSSG